MAELNVSQGYGLLVLYCVIYVLPLHISPAARASPHRSRDDPSAIQARIFAVSCSTTLCSITTLIILYHLDSHNALHLMGYWPVDVVSAAKALLLTATLFAAPLYESLWIDGEWKSLLTIQPLRMVWSEWSMWRNLVAGPVTEECLFRSAAVPLLLAAGVKLSHIITLSPLVFGLAHVHHCYEFRVTNPEVPIPMAILRSLLQLSYTTLFGAYATFLYLRTGSLLAVIAVHTFCNVMGLPRVWGRLQPWWIGPRQLNSSAATIWSTLYYVLLFGGAILWYKWLMPLSASSLALTQF